jgi:hypothetical protein
MKTAMTELIDDLKNLKKSSKERNQYGSFEIGMNYAIARAELRLEKEKEDLMKAFSDGQETPINHPTLPHYSRDEYYNDNYNQDN